MSTENTPPVGVTMLWMESTRVGSAARTHMDGTRSRLDSAGIPVRSQIFSEAVNESALGKISRLIGLVRAARRAAHRGVLVTRWHPFVAFVAPRWRRKGGRVLLLVQGNDDSTYETNPWLRRVPGIRKLMTRSLGMGSYVLCVNRGLADWVRSERSARADVPIEVMPSGVSDVFFDADPVDIGEPYVLFFGGLAPWQGIDYMLEAHRSASWPRGLKLLVIGDGAKAEAVEAAQGPTLEWLGRRRPEELAGYVAGALVTLCPKSNTGSMAKVTTPFKMLESAAAGVPVIATDIPAQVDMLSEGYGALVSADDPEDLARAVAGIASDPARRSELVERAKAFSPQCRWSYAAPQLARAVKSLEDDIASS
ncbi:glycosyltransferase family 4 protein [Microbacterium betulae]|uniref:Glycosyltransferase family 4 protein n=1 Tax=Microbacterium betulae TaxID=2981139 RepID=A0AA97FGB4_9MICO|nr:glycosyltransferase family 4 protein [Microbacterium sp. AB]WOF22363.1 glycosyltransferase family 4 protein [Microbacterium sp. AB]